MLNNLRKGTNKLKSMKYAKIYVFKFYILNIGTDIDYRINQLSIL